jgi:hypothetical protein
MRTQMIMLISSCLFLSTGLAQPADPLFTDSDLLELILVGPFSDIDRQRDKSESYEGSLSYTDEAGATIVLDTKLEARGNWRLQKRNCGYAQLWLDVKRGQAQGTLFDEQNRLKLVVQCGQRSKHEQWVFKEQLAYDLFSVVSGLNFDTRLARISYQDSENPSSERSHYAFLIEHQNRLADRFSMAKVEENSVVVSLLDPLQANLTALFMYMIGNTDFALLAGPEGQECCHNAKLLLDSNGIYQPIPYDFDSSGFVDAEYASPPNPVMRIRTNKQRRYRGYCAHEENFIEAVAHMRRIRPEVERLVAENVYLTDKNKRTASGYIADFYEVLADERKLKRDVIDDCR